MSYFNNISNAISTLVDGMKVTMGYFVRPREHVTLQYPDEVWPVPSRNIGVGELDAYNTIRSKLTVNINDCIGCRACERACPVNCITIDAYKGGPEEDLGTTSNGTKIKLLVANFTIDMSECMYCDLCTPPCPEDCIVMTPDYQFISNDNLKTEVTPEERWRDRDLLIYQFSKVPEEERQRLKTEAEEAAQAKALAMAAKKAEAEKAAADKAAAEEAAIAEGVSSQTSPTQTESSPAQDVIITAHPANTEASMETANSVQDVTEAEELTQVNISMDTIAPGISLEDKTDLPESENISGEEEITRINIPMDTITASITQEEKVELPENENNSGEGEDSEDRTTEERENG
ncbi:MAG: 4Fe-4S dicluster domain-containing protein [Candidatus Marinimicrobia bacterium]|nr:4Fe-4S dicluster domain-containing protein [Candidatus Neomarinimicrobiota bacterium]